MKPGMSAARTGVLPRSRAREATDWTTSGEVRAPAMTSMRGIAGAGLKKCMPTTRSGCWAEAAMEVMEREEVLEARMAPGAAWALREEKISCLRSSDSGAASRMTG